MPKNIRRQIATRPRAACSLLPLVAAGLLASPPAMARPTVPGSAMPAANALPVPSTGLPFVNSGSASVASSGSTMTVTSASRATSLNWDRFWVGSNATVNFNYATPNDANFRVLNRIWSADPSVIMGKINSLGQIYLINQNGILFGNGSQVNVGGLVASTLNIQDSVFNAGLLSPFMNGGNQSAAFSFEGDLTLFGKSFVRVDNGARITSAEGGQIMLFAPRVENAGRLETPGGQTILAAGAKVYLAQSSDPAMRGLLVEVDPFRGTDAAGNPVTAGGTAINAGIEERTVGGGRALADVVGQITANRGNVTLVGLAVNQAGIVRATSTVQENGSIYLRAQDTAIASMDATTNLYQPHATRGGDLVVDVNSVTEVLNDASSQQSVDSQTLYRSSVALQGQTVHVLSGAAVRATGGDIAVEAAVNPLSAATVAQGDARIVVDAGATLDASGSRDVPIAMARNQMSGQLYSLQLQDSPLQRQGILFGKTVYYDLRQGIGLADGSGFVAGITRGIDERTAAGGNVSFKSEGAVVLNGGATVDVSGGWLDYGSGGIVSTKLVAQDGRIFDISTAPKNLVYVSMFNATPRGLEAGYQEGKSAGSVSVSGAQMVVDAQLKGGVTRGLYQRTPATSPSAGRLSVTAFGVPAAQPDILISGQRAALSAAFDADPMHADLGARGATTLIPADLFGAGGFGGLAVNSESGITLAADARLAMPNGAVNLSGAAVEIDGSIFAPGGTIRLGAQPTDVVAREVTVNVAAGSTLSTAGSWVNDRAATGSGLLTTSGGSIEIDSLQAFRIAAGSLLDVSAGAWLQSNGQLAKGTAGSIVLNSNTGVGASMTDIASYAPVTLLGQLRGYGFAGGGTLAMRLPKVRIGGTAATGEFAVAPDFFSSGGFTGFAIDAPAGFTVADNTVIAPVVQTWLPATNYQRAPSDTAMASLTQATVLAPELRSPVNLSFAASGNLDAASYPAATAATTVGRLTVGQGAQIVTGVGGRLSFSAGDRLTFLGTATAPSGSISLAISTTANNSFVYEPDQVLWLGSGASLNAAGGARIFTDGLGRHSGQVLDGGTISLTANRGYVVAAAGAVLDVSGTSATLDLATDGTGRASVAPTPLASNGGAINLTAREGVLVDATLRGGAGGAGARGGALAVKVTNARNDPPSLTSYYPLSAIHYDPAAPGTALAPDRTLLVAAGDAVPAGLAPGQALPDSAIDQGRISAERIDAGQFADVALSADRQIRFQGNSTLTAQRAIVLNAPVIAGAAASTTGLVAPYVDLANPDPTQQKQQTADGGDAQLNVSAGLIDFDGVLGLSGFSRSQFTSSSDIRFRGLLNDDLLSTKLLGRLDSAGELDFHAGQIYPTTLSNFTLAVASGANSLIRFAGGGESGTPLSAGGSLSVNADRIEQGGDVRAPFGSIALNGVTSVQLLPGSVTSVSGDGNLIPMGQTQNGKTWIYDLGSGQATLILSAPPERRIDLNAPTVDIHTGASVNLAGGGDLLASEWIPGLGGSMDYLNQPGLYAVLPGYNRPFAPSDFKVNSYSDLKPGDRITLSGGGGLAAGTYTLLPAYYALLPGAFVVTPQAGHTDLRATDNQTFADGSALVAGRRGSVSGATDARRSGFLVESRTVALSRAEYTLTTGSAFFPAAAANAGIASPRVGRDAGVLAISATTSLSLDGAIDLSPDGSTAGGRGGSLDISAPNLAIVDGGQAAPSGYLAVDGGKLSAIGAESVMLGAVRHANAMGSYDLAVGADNVVVDNSGGTLKAGEVVLAAKTGVTLADKASIAADTTGAARGDALNVAGDGALLRVANDTAGRAVRTGTAGSSGLLSIGKNVALKGPVVELDGSKDTKIGSGGSIDAKVIRVAASAVSFGSVPVGTGGLVVDAGLQTALGAARDLGFRSYSSIDFYGPVTFGSRDQHVDSLTLDASALTSQDGNTVNLTAGQIVLQNTTGQTAASAGGTGTLTLTATDAGSRAIVVGSGDKQLNGFSTATLSTPGEISTEGTGTLTTAGAMTLTGASLTGASRADQTLTAASALTTTRSADAVAALPAATGLGAKLKLSGASVANGLDIDLPAGSVTLQATGGGASDDVTVNAGATVRAAGVRKVFDSVPVYTNAGSVTLSSANSSVKVAAGGTVDVSADGGGGDGGAFTASAANGTVDLAGTLKGAGGSGGAGGRIAVDSKALATLGALADKASASGFTESFAARVRTGDVSLESGKTITARNVSLSVDGGKLNLQGTIAADGATAGSVLAYAHDDLTLAAGAKITALSSGSGKAGGNVTLGSTIGTLTLAGADAANALPAASIDLTGGAGGQGGTLTLRAQRKLRHPTDPRPNAVQVAAVGANITGASTINIEAVKTYGAGSVTSLNIGTTGTLYQDTQSFVAASNVDTVKTELGLAGDSRVHVTPGIEIDTGGAFNFDADWNLGATATAGVWHANGEGGALTIRAGGGINFTKTLSDGFATTAETEKTLVNATGWNYRLAAGADLSAADPLAVKAASTAADLTLGSAAMIRTGAGSIAVAAARDITLAPLAGTSSTTASMIYSAGRPDAASDLTGVNVPANATFTHGGGSVALIAGRDVIGAASDQLAANWLWRRGSLATNGNTFINGNAATAWWTRFDLFRQNVGALGGGNVTVTAGRDVKNLSVAVPTNGRISGLSASIANLTVENGGDATVRAGGDIVGGQTLVMKGTGTLEAGGDMTQGTPARTGQAATLGLYPVLELGDGQFRVQAVGDVNIEAVINPTQVGQISGNASSGRSQFFTYGSDSGVSLTSLVGDVSLLNDVSTLDKVTKDSKIPSSERLALSTTVGNSPLTTLLQVYPPNLHVAAFSGSVVIPRAVWLLPATNAALDVFAHQDIRFAGVDGLSGSVYQSDADPAAFPTPVRPSSSATVPLGGVPNVAKVHAAVPVHLGDPNPSRFVAETGDIIAGDSAIASATEARIVAGRDIVDLGFYGQNANGGDTVITAGRDIRYSEARSTSNNSLISNAAHVELGGTGNLFVTAGRDIDLGSSTGIISRGNLNNLSGLPEAGASIHVMAGMNAGLDLAAFSLTYLDSAKRNYRADLLAYVRTATGDPGIVDATAATAFATLSTDQQLAFADQVTAAEFTYRYLQAPGSFGLVQSYLAAWSVAHPGLDPKSAEPVMVIDFARSIVWQELSAAGKSAASAGSPAQQQQDYQRGYEALGLAKLGGPYRFQGDLKMIFSQIKTERGGGIDLYVPGGGVNVGLATLPAGFSKDPANLGILALKAGDVHALVDQDFEVNKSRVFTLLGGNILIWSSYGGIDAGKGAKTSFVVPPPLITYDSNGIPTVEYPGIASGSGIGALQTDVNVAAGSVELYAPTGTVNAGEAGIRAQNVTIAAARVLGAENITATGSVSGAPVAAPSTAAAPAPPNTAGTQRPDGPKGDSGNANHALGQGILTVEVLDIGDGTGSSSDDEQSEDDRKKNKKNNR